ncbi:serine hydrolase domain-containing protein [Winogradskyella maritima]|uniref:Serine hydrolase domain-containing protein n=1 Tax=Winogradskyella maritima TaxID=1517766 RepID=A0ABV8AIF7_9FLAO|nr:serine hydrolase domain-containing protein [Winogradskyella maritima]
MKKLSYILLLLISINFCQNGYAQSKYIKTVSGKKVSISTLESRIEHIMDSIQLPGLSIAIINDAKIAYHNKFGVSNLKTQEPVTTESIFEGASLSKPLFAYFIMKMVEQGKFNLDEPIYDFLKDIFPENTIADDSFEAYKRITPRIVLSHGTGIPNWVKGKPIEIAFEPGTDFSYSGEAYQHMGAALGTKLGIGWGSQLDSLFLKEVAHPLGMQRSFYTWNDVLEKHTVKGHMNGKVNMEMHRDKKVGPGYSLQSDAYDYALFLIEMMKSNNLSPTLRDLMLKEHNHFKPDNKIHLETGQTGWGLGFAQKPTPNGMMHLHTGNNHDFQAYAMFVPDQKYGFVMFGNSNNLFPFLTEIEKLIEEQF